MGTNDAWLALHEEPALDPELKICDPHHHLWDHRGEGVAPRYLLDDFLADVAQSGHNVVSSVFIECGTMFNADAQHRLKPIGETEFANGQAAMAASGQYGHVKAAAGIVGTAYLTEGASIADVLDKQIETAPARFRGIRQAASWDASPDVGNHRTEPAPGMYLDRSFQAGFAQLAERELSFEAWCFHPQISELTQLAQAFPDTTIILDHFGGPIGIGPYANRQEDVFDVWKRDIKALAACPNVHAKLGGLAMPVNGYAWNKNAKPPSSYELLEANKRYYEFTIEAFGVERCMFESNFPVDRVSVSYGVLWNMFKRLTEHYSVHEREALFHDNAARLYRI
ncbi:MAG: amidohydrolase family protein [Gammaproteobacteria bacterium]